MHATTRQPAHDAAKVAIEELIAADSHLDQAAALISRYSWPQGKAAELKESLTGIRRRRQDDSLYLAVVGEFSSGKSSWINGFLREDLLPTSVIAATTAAVTILRHGKRRSMEVLLRGGEKLTFAASNPRASGSAVSSSFAEPLAKYVAEEKSAREVESVTIFSPAPALAEGLVLLDTPGNNVDNPRHVEVARWAIQEACDAALVLIPAKLQLASSYVQFLKTHLSEGLHRCIFLVTMIDQIAPRDRNSVISTVKQRLTSLLGVEDPPVLPVSAAAVLEDIAPGRYELSSQVGEAEKKQLVADLARSEAFIRETLRRQRTLIVLERLAVLMDRLYGDLEVGLAEMESQYKEEHRALLENRISDLAGFAGDSKAKHRSGLDAAAARTTAKAGEAIDDARKKASQKLSTALGRASTHAELDAVLTNGFPAALAEAQRDLLGPLAKKMKNLSKAALQEAGEFEAHFVELYRSLASLGGRKDLEKLDSSIPVWNSTDWSGEARQLATIAAEAQNASNARTGSAVTFGVVLGGLALGPIGAVFGGILGSFLGSIFGPSPDQRRPELSAAIGKQLKKVFGDVKAAMSSEIEVRRGELECRLDELVDRYVARYDGLVRKMLDEDNRKARELEARRRNVGNDAEDLARRRRELAAAREGLRKIREA